MEFVVRMHEWTGNKNNNNILMSINARSCATGSVSGGVHECNFKLIQDELQGMLFFNSLLVKVDGARYVFHVTYIMEGKHGDFKKQFIYIFRGIICRNMVKILIEMDVKEIHPWYILSWWRKDMKLGLYLVISCYEDLMSSENAKHFDHLCSNLMSSENAKHFDHLCSKTNW
uniref:Uncharacterized protein n=1 Tax=Lactuca sativa TaxID=4236 RepID=A0A9R1WMQ2_LACSA|nr:hypothetical protein LSAT_V11C100010210 [Lactuca sativa]